MDPLLHELQAEIQDRHWWFRGRRRFIQSVLSSFDPGRKVLEVGCGTGANYPVLSETGRYLVGLDLSDEALSYAPHDPRVKGDGVNMPFQDGTFDLVVALDVLEHVVDDGALARELRRVTRPGGRVLVFVPAFSFLWGVQDELSHHVRRYTRKTLLNVLRCGGLEAERISYFNTWLFLPILCVRFFQRMKSRFHDRLDGCVRSENEYTPAWLDGPLAALLRSEALAYRYMDLPIGVSLVVLTEPVG